LCSSGQALAASVSVLCFVLSGTASATIVTYDESPEATFTVPAGVTEIHILAIGGHGGYAEREREGGTGARVAGDLAVSPGEKLYVVVGGEGDWGSRYSGFNGGGTSTSGSGGGASDVRTAPRAAGLNPDDRLVVAGGGGGAGGLGWGGDAGEEGGEGRQTGPYECSPGECASLEEEIVGGSPGTQTAGGAGGAGCEFWGDGALDGEPGGRGIGGEGGNAFGEAPEEWGGGGGGGGYYGGGGGGGTCPEEGFFGWSAGGGGGASLIPPGGELSLAGEEEALVQISYASAAPIVNGITPSKGPPSGGTPIVIAGENFTGTTSVSFGSVQATKWTVDSDSEITAVAPAGTGKVYVHVNTPSGTNSTHPWDKYAYKAERPTITSLNPNHGPTAGGTPVGVTGTGFVPGSTTFKFGSVTAASVTCSSSTSCTATAPPAKKDKAGTVDVVAAVGKAKSKKATGNTYTYSAG
jgi:hypothetical protein